MQESRTAAARPEARTPPRRAESTGPSGRRRGLGRRGWLLAALGVIVAAAGGAIGWGVMRIRGSLPQLDGTRRLAGLGAEVRVERDELGVPTVHAATRVDAARALGFLHAQDRFFQMDLLRRRSAGELAELVGPAALTVDREARVHRFRAVARRALAACGADDRAWLEAYAAGANAGLAALAAPPVEYLAIGGPPRAWLPEDSFLCVLSMFIDLQDDAAPNEALRGLLHDTLPPRLAAFLLPDGGRWDAPLEGESLPAAALPTAEVRDLRREPPTFPPALLATDDRLAAKAWRWPATGKARGELVVGSNNWAVAGPETESGAALLAGDMHLRLGVPCIWYRAALTWPGVDGPRRVVGVTLPGAPVIVAGSTGRIAWAFTNTQGDWADLVIVEPDPADPTRYRTPEGMLPFGRETEILRVKGGADETLEITTTIWGPVVDRDHRGRSRVLRWTAHDAAAVNLRLRDLEEAADVDDAVRIAPKVGVPAQNLVCADSGGRLAWTIIGRIPRRRGDNPRVPVSWADGAQGWDGWVAADDYPRLVDPRTGRLWTANARVADPAGAKVIGDEGQDLGARQGQIRDALLRLDRAKGVDMLALQLDDRALFLERWREVLLDLLTPARTAGHPRRAEVRQLVEAWGGRAAVDSVGYRIVRDFRGQVAERALQPLLAPARAADERCDYVGLFHRWEIPLWELIEQRPGHLLDARHADWDALLLAALDAVVERLAGRGPLGQRTWGERNMSLVRHPLTAAVPAFADWLDMDPRPLPGDNHMPRVQTPFAGASQRMVVSPGREEEGFFHMPAGQSGHPLSPHYGDGHDAWAEGQPTPFLPGPSRHMLILVP
jgi:penicillin amidase